MQALQSIRNGFLPTNSQTNCCSSMTFMRMGRVRPFDVERTVWKVNG